MPRPGAPTTSTWASSGCTAAQFTRPVPNAFAVESPVTRIRTGRDSSGRADRSAGAETTGAVEPGAVDAGAAAVDVGAGAVVLGVVVGVGVVFEVGRVGVVSGNGAGVAAGLTLRSTSGSSVTSIDAASTVSASAVQYSPMPLGTTTTASTSTATVDTAAVVNVTRGPLARWVRIGCSINS